MITYLVVTGPTHARTDGGLYGDTFISSFADRLNAALKDLTLKGARNITVDCKPSSQDWHVGYVSYDGELSAKTETISIEGFAEHFDISRSTVRDRMRRGIIAYSRVGRKYIIPQSEITRLSSLPSW